MTQKLRTEGHYEFWQVEYKNRAEAFKDYDWEPINLSVLRHLPIDMRGDLTTRMRTPEPFRSYVGTGDVYLKTGNLGCFAHQPVVAIANALVTMTPHLKIRIAKVELTMRRGQIIELTENEAA